MIVSVSGVDDRSGLFRSAPHHPPKDRRQRVEAMFFGVNPACTFGLSGGTFLSSAIE